MVGVFRKIQEEFGISCRNVQNIKINNDFYLAKEKYYFAFTTYIKEKSSLLYLHVLQMFQIFFTHFLYLYLFFYALQLTRDLLGFEIIQILTLQLFSSNS